jgi:hypothetical protein
MSGIAMIPFCCFAGRTTGALSERQQ